MKIIIVGIGKLGEYLTRRLVDDNNDITLVDVDFTTSRDIIDNLDVNYIYGSGLDVNVLKEVGIEDCDLFISVMDKDEHNVISCLLASKLGAKHTIARIRTPEYSNSIDILKEELGLSMVINPELMTGEKIARVLGVPSALEETTFFKGRVQMISVKVKKKSVLDGISIHNLSKKVKGVIVCAIERDNEMIVPKGNVVLKEEDTINITGSPKDISSFLKYTDLSEKTKDVIICGGSNIAIYLARNLIEMGMNVKIIEIDEERCKLLSEKLPKAVIINGDVSDQYVLCEEGIDECDAFVTLTSIDEENIICSMFANLHGVPKIITKINHISLDGVVEKADIDTIITPHKIAANQIVKYVRAMKQGENSSCEAIYKLKDDTFEMLEFNVKDDFNELDVPIKNMTLKDSVLIVAILRDKSVIYPGGNDVIKNKDTILVIDNDSSIKDLNDILR